MPISLWKIPKYNNRVLKVLLFQNILLNPLLLPNKLKNNKFQKKKEDFLVVKNLVPDLGREIKKRNIKIKKKEVGVEIIRKVEGDPVLLLHLRGKDIKKGIKKEDEY